MISTHIARKKRYSYYFASSVNSAILSRWFVMHSEKKTREARLLYITSMLLSFSFTLFSCGNGKSRIELRGHDEERGQL